MVELLTDYTTQIYHALSTDARPDADPGAQLREIDTGKRFIFDGSAWNELPDGGGGSSPVVLGSGDYTLASYSSVMTIPVSYTPGTVTSFVVYKEEQTGTFAWCYIYDTLDATDGVFKHMTNVKYSRQAEWSANNYVEQPVLADNAITVHGLDATANNIKAGTYHWVIYGR